MELASGTLLDGRYRLSAVLGSGGMGTVYEAEDLRLGRRVAIKVLLQQGDDTLAERLFREAKAAARADHPAVVTCYGFGSDPELEIDYLVMERLVGETLAQRLERERKLPAPFVVQLALELADALVAVHATGVIHRDLKPGNIFLATRGRRRDEVKLLDFGLAKQIGLHSLTSTGDTYGTVSYMAPEQLADAKRVDARCDLYSLGAVLFECVAGQPAFAGDDAVARMAQIMAGEQLDLRALRPDLSSALVRLIERCMMRAPSERFADAASVARALEAID